MPWRAAGSFRFVQWGMTMAENSKTATDGSPDAGADDRQGVPGQHRVERWRASVPKIVLVAFVIGIATVGLLGATFGISIPVALLWGFALYASGALIGFLFGIPRIADRDAVLAGPAVAAPADGAPDRAGQRQEASSTRSARAKQNSGINSNLVEVSDWLTKIIVGVGLVELKQLPGYAKSLAAFMADSLVASSTQPHPSMATLTSVAGALGLGFGVLGFITGYLMTRIFLAIIMNDSDRSAEEASQVRTPYGRWEDAPKLLEWVAGAVVDLQSVRLKDGQAERARPVADANAAPPVAQVEPDPAAAMAQSAEQAPGRSASAMARQAPPVASASAQAPSRVRAILWVDDRPEHNRVGVDRLRSAGIEVEQVKHTDAAVEKLKRKNFGVIITDMHRGEKAGDGRPSGIRLIEIVQNMFTHPERSGPRPLVMMFCSSSSFEKHGEWAKRAGADVVTASEVELLENLARCYPGLT